jgi:LmbE family N-acetylglucosaminyl deacetylase
VPPRPGIPAPAPPGGDAPIVVLSPHLDDAVFSCGGILAAARAAGRRVEVVTVFARPPDPASVPERLRAFARYDERFAEDDRALALLGASATRLDFVERAFRSPPLAGPGAVFRSLPRGGPSGLSNLPALTAAVRERLARRPEAVILAPLGVGRHVDHVEVFLAAVHAAIADRPGSRLWFYEDVYALVPSARRGHFVTRRCPLPRAGLFAGGTLRTSLLGRALALATGGPRLEGLVPPEALAGAWRVAPVAISAHEAEKIAAVRAYASQLAALGGEGWIGVMRRQHTLWGGAEPLWSLGPACGPA